MSSLCSARIAVVAPTHVRVAKVAVASLPDQAPLIEISTRTTNRSDQGVILIVLVLASYPLFKGKDENLAVLVAILGV